MRDDIAKKLTERARFAGYSSTDKGRRTTKGDDYENMPKQESMRIHHIKNFEGKELNEYFPPLLGFLKSKVGHGWDNVYSEIAALLNPSSTIHKHVLDHLFNDFVELHPVFHNGLPYHHRGFGYGQVRNYYVDNQGILRDAESPKLNKLRKRLKRQAIVDNQQVHLTPRTAYYKIDKVWYFVRFEKAKPGKTVYDVVLKRKIQVSKDSLWKPWELIRAHGPMKLDGVEYPRYATERRQISKKEIRREGLK